MNNKIMNGKNRNKLLISTPKLTTYTQHAHLLSILGTYEPTEYWIYSNYINIYANTDLIRNSWADFYFSMPYELRPSDCCKWLTTQKVQRSFFTSIHESFLDFCTHAIDEGWYVHVMLDYFHIPGANNFEQNHRIHDVLIYGYDVEQEKIYANDFLLTGKYASFDIPMNRINSAFDDYSKAWNQDFIKGNIYLYKIDKNL